jgi:hypothetical protein
MKTLGSRWPKITRRRRGELIRSLFEVLLPHPDGLLESQAIAEVEQRTPPSRAGTHSLY